MAKALEQIAASHTGDDTITIVLPKKAAMISIPKVQRKGIFYL